jgi:hypothetical protein
MAMKDSDRTSGLEISGLAAARTRLARAEEAVEAARKESRAAKRRRKEAKEETRRAKKRLRRAREERDEARRLLNETEAKPAVKAPPRAKPVIARATPARKKKRKPAKKAKPKSNRRPDESAPAAKPVDVAEMETEPEKMEPPAAPSSPAAQ